MPKITPSSHEASHRMARVRQKGTKAEIKIRRELHSRGLRYRLQVPVLSKPRRTADIAFHRQRLAIFVNGCFWHGCPAHASWPKSNAEFWRNKIEANIARDDDTNRWLEMAGWKAIRAWEHEDAVEASDRTAKNLASAGNHRGDG